MLVDQRDEVFQFARLPVQPVHVIRQTTTRSMAPASMSASISLYAGRWPLLALVSLSKYSVTSDQPPRASLYG